MILRALLRWKIGLGLTVGAILHGVAVAQVTPPVGGGTNQADSLSLRQIADSIAAADTLRAPIDATPVPRISDADYSWDHDQILASGASSLAELIAGIPGGTIFRAGYGIAPANVAWLGNFAGVRVYLDGIEMAALNPRGGGILDLAEIPLWGLEHVRVVRGGSELRVYLRSWTVEKTIPFTKVDVLTGSDETSMFGLQFGRRFQRGEVLQIAAQQFGTHSRVNSGSGVRRHIVGRLGIVKEKWGLDAFLIRSPGTREAQERSDGGAPLTAFEGTRTDAYVRARLGQPSEGKPWFEFLAASMNVKENAPGTGPVGDDLEQPPADTSQTEAQYVLSAGRSLGALDAAISARFRASGGVHSNDLTLNASTVLRGTVLSGLVRRDTRDSTLLTEVAALAEPLPFVQVSGIVGQIAGISTSSGAASLFARGEVGLRLGAAWLRGGVMVRDSVLLLPPSRFDTSLVAASDPAATGVYASLRGRIWRSVHVDINVVGWDGDGWYRPELETKATLYVDSWALSRFPNSTFHIHASATHESRGEVRFPGSGSATFVAPSHSSISALLEIRVLTAVIFWQNRNLRGLEYVEVPGLEMPRRLNVYGVRWVLWN